MTLLPARSATSSRIRSVNQTRIARATVAATVATIVAWAFHSSSGGSSSVLSLAVTFVVTLWLSVLLAGRAWGTVALTFIVGVAQFAMHWLMSFIPTHSSGTGAIIESSHLFHDHTLTASHHSGGGNAMVVAHIFATVVTVAIFRWGEKLLTALAAEVAGTAISYVSWARPVVTVAGATVVTEVAVLRTQASAYELQPRAPPVSV